MNKKWLSLGGALILAAVATGVYLFKTYRTSSMQQSGIKELDELLRQRAEQAQKSKVGQAYSSGDVNYLVERVKTPKSDQELEDFFRDSIFVLDRKDFQLTEEKVATIKDVTFSYLESLGSSESVAGSKAKSRALAIRVLSKFPTSTIDSPERKRLLALIDGAGAGSNLYFMLLDYAASQKPMDPKVIALVEKGVLHKEPNFAQQALQILGRMPDSKVQIDLLKKAHDGFSRVASEVRPLLVKLLILHAPALKFSQDQLFRLIPSPLESSVWTDVFVFACENIGFAEPQRPTLQALANKADDEMLVQRARNLLVQRSGASE